MIQRAHLGLIAAALLLTGTDLVAQGTLTTIEFYSPAVARTLKYNIALPRDYEGSTDRYPVLYLIHGNGGSYAHWGDLGAPSYGRVFWDLIIVMLDAGRSWCVNYDASSGGQKNDWQDYIVRDVVSHVDSNFRTIDRREGRAIGGLSMGGYCAFTIGLHHPEVFVSVGATSGSLDWGRRASRRLRGEASDGRRMLRAAVASPPPQAAPPSADELRLAEERARAVGIPGFSTQAERTPDGTQFLTAEAADRYDPFILIHQVPRDRLPHFYLDSGTEDPLIAVAREFAQVLFSLDIPFDFMQMPGVHDSVYWSQSAGHMISVQYEVLRRALGERPTWHAR